MIGFQKTIIYPPYILKGRINVKISFIQLLHRMLLTLVTVAHNIHIKRLNLFGEAILNSLLVFGVFSSIYHVSIKITA